MDRDRSLRICDIEGQRNTRCFTRNRPNLSLETRDISVRSAPLTNKPEWIQCDYEARRSYAQRRPNFQFDVSDICGKPRTDFTTRRTNPLNPKYLLPSAERVTERELPFIRDQISIADIERSSPATRYTRVKTRDTHTLNYADVVGSTPRVRVRARNAGTRTVSHFDVADITNDHFRSTRVTDPLSPRYKYGKVSDLYRLDDLDTPADFLAHKHEDDVATIGDIDGSHPRSRTQVGTRRRIATKVDYTLRTEDVPGARGGFESENRRVARARQAERTAKRRAEAGEVQPRPASLTVYEGAVKPSGHPASARRTNPLSPRYRYLGAAASDLIAANHQHEEHGRANNMGVGREGECVHGIADSRVRYDTQRRPRPNEWREDRQNEEQHRKMNSPAATTTVPLAASVVEPAAAAVAESAVVGAPAVDPAVDEEAVGGSEVVAQLTEEGKADRGAIDDPAVTAEAVPCAAVLRAEARRRKKVAAPTETTNPTRAEFVPVRADLRECGPESQGVDVREPVVVKPSGKRRTGAHSEVNSRVPSSTSSTVPASEHTTYPSYEAVRTARGRLGASPITNDASVERMGGTTDAIPARVRKQVYMRRRQLRDGTLTNFDFMRVGEGLTASRAGDLAQRRQSLATRGFDELAGGDDDDGTGGDFDATGTYSGGDGSFGASNGDGFSAPPGPAVDLGYGYIPSGVGPRSVSQNSQNPLLVGPGFTSRKPQVNTHAQVYRAKSVRARNSFAHVTQNNFRRLAARMQRQQRRADVASVRALPR